MATAQAAVVNARASVGVHSCVASTAVAMSQPGHKQCTDGRADVGGLRCFSSDAMTRLSFSNTGGLGCEMEADDRSGHVVPSVLNGQQTMELVPSPRMPLSQLVVRSTTQCTQPITVPCCSPQRAIFGRIPGQPRMTRVPSQSYPRSAYNAFGRLIGRAGFSTAV